MKSICALTVLLTATTAFGQTPPTDKERWAAWMGCWQVSEESVEDAERLLGALTGAPATPSSRTGARVCVAPAPEGGATMTTTVNNKAVLTETIVADGVARPLTDPSCRGAQQAEWSQLGPRIYARTEVTCGDGPKRIVSGFSAVVSGPLWVDIQLIESEGRKSMRVRRYRPAADQQAVTSTARTLGTTALGGKLSLAEIKEASTKLAPEAVQAAVMELGGGGYDLNAQRLLELDDAGVHDSVIDLMVAMSFPKKFIVERAGPVSGPGALFPMGTDYGMDPYGMGFMDSYSRWSYFAHPMYYSTLFSPFGYYNWGYYDPYNYGNPGVVIINPGGGNGGTPEPTGTGRVVDGQGYTRIRPNVPDSPSRTNSGGNWSGTSAGSSSGSNGGSSSGGVSTGGYSGGGGGGERVAVPRPPGGN